MADDDFETPEIWDEYQWERFLQQQDRNTEKYFGLLEKYLDHPDRDSIIAREMGWESFDEDRDAEWDEVAESLCEEEMSSRPAGAGMLARANSRSLRDLRFTWTLSSCILG